MSGESLNGFYFEELSLGQTAVFGKTVTEAELKRITG